MGGVRKKFLLHILFMLIGTLALTGFPFLSGFYSKDAIIEFAYLKTHHLGNYAATIGIFTAFLHQFILGDCFLKHFMELIIIKKF